MLDTNMKAQLQGYLERITQPVEIVASLDEGEPSREMLELLNDIESVSSLVKLDAQRDETQLKPSFALRRPGAVAQVRFAGVPMGHEFTSLVLALLQTGGYAPKIDAATADQIRNLDGDFNFETFVSLTCQSCPDVVQALNAMAALNPRIRHTMIDGAVYQDEVARREVMAVPAVFLNGRPFGQGRMELEEIIHKLDSGAAAAQAEKLNAKAPYDVLVVGGGPAGAAAAIYAARKGIRTGIAAERLGGQLLDTVGIENFISVTETQGHKLASGFEQHVTTYDVDVMNLQRAAALKPGEPIEVALASGAVLKAKSVIIATGAQYNRLPLARLAEFEGIGVYYAATQAEAQACGTSPVAVVGGGNSAGQAALFLSRTCAEVHIVIRRESLDASMSRYLTDRIEQNPRITVWPRTQVTALTGTGELQGVRIGRAGGQGESELAIRGLFVFIGARPRTGWLAGQLAADSDGFLLTGTDIAVSGVAGDTTTPLFLETSRPGIFAVGDVRSGSVKRAAAAIGEGSMAVRLVFDRLQLAGSADPIELGSSSPGA